MPLSTAFCKTRCTLGIWNRDGTTACRCTEKPSGRIAPSGRWYPTHTSRSSKKISGSGYKLPPQKLEAALQRIQRRRQSAYEDYQDALISKEDFLRYRADYDAQEQALQAQLDKLRGTAQDDPLCLPWVKELLASGQLAELDRPTVAAAIREIRVYEGNRMEIDYLLPEGCRALLEG